MPLLNALLPPLCLACETEVSAPHGFCGGCWQTFHFITPPLCTCCGLPFDFETGLSEGPALCAACLAEKPCFEKARAVFRYDDAARRVLLPFKHHDRTDLAPALARLMLQAGKELLEEADLLVPVPLHFFRLFMRRYNQAVLLVRALARLAHKPALLDGLKRIRATPSQGHLSREERRQNVKGAFAVTARARPKLLHKTVLLVDDVVTTGATAHACATALMKAGARRVDVLALARVSRE